MGGEGNLKTKFGLGITKLKKKKPDTREFNSKEKNTHSKRVHILPPQDLAWPYAFLLQARGTSVLSLLHGAWGTLQSILTVSDAQVIVSQAWVWTKHALWAGPILTQVTYTVHNSHHHETDHVVISWVFLQHFFLLSQANIDLLGKHFRRDHPG